MPLELFYSYARQDEDLRNKVENSLSLLRRRGLIVGWHDRDISAGAQWATEINDHVKTADIILLLISPDFLASDYCWGVETKLALERHEKHEATVVPIILRPVDWSAAPFSFLQALPRNAKAVTSWANPDEALVDIATGIRKIVERLESSRGTVGVSSHRCGTAAVDASLVHKAVSRSTRLELWALFATLTCIAALLSFLEIPKLFYRQGSQYAYIASENYVSVLDTASLVPVSTIAVPKGRHAGMKVTPDGNYLFVTNEPWESNAPDNTISIIDLKNGSSEKFVG